MICRLYELYNDTGIDVGATEDCTPECQDYDESKPDCPCVACSNREVKLCKNTKFGWTKVRTIQFTGVEILENDETAYQIIKLIHPSKSNVWIVRWLSKNKMGFKGFVAWFIGGLLGVFTLEILFQNPFVKSLIVSLVLAVLGAKE